MVRAPVWSHATLRVWVKAVKVFCSWCGGNFFQLSFLVEFAVPAEALGVTELFATNAAFVIFCPRVHGLMLAQVKSLSKILSANCAVMRLFTGVDAVVSA